MPRPCSICASPNLADVDRALGAGEPYRVVAERFALGPSAVFRHRKEHVSRLAEPQPTLLQIDLGPLEQRLDAAEMGIQHLAQAYLTLWKTRR